MKIYIKLGKTRWRSVSSMDTILTITILLSRILPITLLLGRTLPITTTLQKWVDTAPELPDPKMSP